MSIIAIDPGTSNTGLVHMDDKRIIDAHTLRFRHVIRADQDMLRERAAEISMLVRSWIAERPHEAIVIEGFMGYPGKGGGYVFHTPYLIGYLHADLASENVVIQTSRQVLNPRTKGNVAHIRDAMESGGAPYPGSKLCTNDHLRAAACHGIYYYRSRRA